MERDRREGGGRRSWMVHGGGSLAVEGTRVALEWVVAWVLVCRRRKKKKLKMRKRHREREIYDVCV